MPNYLIYEIQLQDLARGTTLATAGGKMIVCANGSYGKATLYNPDSNFASLANPVSATRGKFRFATGDTVTSVDVYGYDQNGRAFVRTGLKPGADNEIFVTENLHQVMVIPFLGSDYTAASENDTGFDFPAGAVVLPNPAVRVVTAQSSKTIDVGLLSTESGGDADGYLVAASLGTAGTVRGSLVGTDTLGALLKGDTNGSSVLVPEGGVIGAATSISITPNSGTTTAAGMILLPYMRLPA